MIQSILVYGTDVMNKEESMYQIVKDNLNEALSAISEVSETMNSIDEWTEYDWDEVREARKTIHKLTKIFGKLLDKNDLIHELSNSSV